jgi:hypothetical protein
MRIKPGQHLSQEGVDLARKVSLTNPDYGLVATSTVPRAIETAIAMGLAVDRYIDALGQLPDAVMDAVGFPSDFPTVAQAARTNIAAARFAAEQADIWRGILENLHDGENALIVTHGLFIEFGAIAILPEADAATWGAAIAYCEGLRLHWEEGIMTGKVLRLPEALRLIEN